MKRHFQLLLAFLFLTFNPTLSIAYGSDNYFLKDLSIILEGEEKGAPPLSITSKLKSQKGSAFTQEHFDEDLKILSRDFDRVIPSLRFEEQDVYATLRLWPKPTIRNINWEGNTKVLTKRLQSELNILIGSKFDRSEFSKAFHKLKAYYVKQGFFEAQLDYRIAIDEITAEADITIEIQEGRSGLIKRLKWVGFTKEEEKELSDRILTKRFNLFFSWMTEEGTYKQEMVDQDEYAILSYIQSKGYADAQVAIQVEEIPNKNRIQLIVTLDRGEIYTFGDITFSGNTLFNDEQIRRSLKVRSGGAFSPDLMRETSQSISDQYGKLGYIDAYVSFEPSLRLNDPVYDVHFHITEGDQYRVGMIKVLGNINTNLDVILHETLLIPGEVFNSTKLQLTEARLQNIGYFECVNVYAVSSDSDCGYGPKFRDVHIEVEEQSTGDFGFSFGYSSTENSFAGLHFTERNFNYRGLPYLLEDGYGALRGGGQYLSAKANFGGKTRTYALSWTEPYFCDSDWAFGFDVEKSNNRSGDRGYETDSLGFGLHATRSINQFVKLGWHYRLKDSDVILPKLETGTHPPQLIEESENSGLISATGLSLIYDSTNHPSSPTDGFRSKFSLEFAGLAGRHDFFTLGYQNTYYSSPWCDFIIKLRADTKLIKPLGDTSLATMPLDERLYLGGETSVRGFAPYGIGPKYSNGAPRGGLSMFLFSQEYVYKAFSKADLFTFADVGTLSSSSWSVGEWRASAGYGLRLYVIPNSPPVTVGMGHILKKGDEDKEKQFFVTMGTRF